MRMVTIAIAACAIAAAGVAAANEPIARADYLGVDGARLFLTVRGADRHAPVLVWLHGGPGGAERPLFRWFDGDLERDFVVAYLDQRGAGRSFDPDADPRELTVARHVADLRAVIAHLRRTLALDRVVLVGHSWGGFLALSYAAAHPGDVAGVIAVSPLVSARRAQQSQYDFVRAEAVRRRDDRALRRLDDLGPPPHARSADFLAVDDLADRYGAVFHQRPSFVATVVGAVFTGLVTPWEIPRFIRGNTVSLDAMTPELLGLDLADSVPRLAVPALFFVGRYDRHVDATITAAYYDALVAPAKQLVWFEASAHNVPCEEPERFMNEVRRVLADSPRG
jgi:pimeloyl-ACP methyl ester carboxylesterase